MDVLRFTTQEAVLFFLMGAVAVIDVVIALASWKRSKGISITGWGFFLFMIVLASYALFSTNHVAGGG
jgi:hypothetical protein